MHYVTVWMQKGRYAVDGDVTPEEARKIAIGYHRDHHSRLHATCVEAYGYRWKPKGIKAWNVEVPA